MQRHFASLVGAGAFIARPGTDFTAEWLREVERRLDYFARPLVENPGSVFGDKPGYPIPWITLLSDVFHPLQLKHLAHVSQDADLTPVLHGHR